PAPTTTPPPPTTPPPTTTPATAPTHPPPSPPATPNPLTFFFFLMPRPPRSTLFPYTTLFRSEFQHGAAREYPSHGRADSQQPQPDRKSTRLNSSHLVISYAVFCLKKKKLDRAHAPVRGGATHDGGPAGRARPARGRRAGGGVR